MIAVQVRRSGPEALCVTCGTPAVKHLVILMTLVENGAYGHTCQKCYDEMIAFLGHAPHGYYLTELDEVAT